MIYYSVVAKIVGSGDLCLKKNTKIPSVKWSCYSEGGDAYRETYVYKSSKVPHFLWWYYSKYHVEYTVYYRSHNALSWDYFLGLKDLHLEDGDIVIDTSNEDKYHEDKYLIVKNEEGQLEHYKILATELND